MFVASLGIPSLLFSARESAGLLHSLSLTVGLSYKRLWQHCNSGDSLD